MRTTGSFVSSTTLGEAVRAFAPHPLPPADPPLDPACYVATHHAAELALARLTGVAGLVPSQDWLLYSALAQGRDRLRFICLWDGNGGDGAGGTAHMVEEVRRRHCQVTWLDTRELW